LAVPVLAHRIIPTAESQLARRTTDAIVAELVHRLPLPTDRQQRSPYDTRTSPLRNSGNGGPGGPTSEQQRARQAGGPTSGPGPSASEQRAQQAQDWRR
jgi:hypothetical protein